MSADKVVQVAKALDLFADENDFILDEFRLWLTQFDKCIFPRIDENGYPVSIVIEPHPTIYGIDVGFNREYKILCYRIPDK